MDAEIEMLIVTAAAEIESGSVGVVFSLEDVLLGLVQDAIKLERKRIADRLRESDTERLDRLQELHIPAINRNGADGPWTIREYIGMGEYHEVSQGPTLRDAIDALPRPITRT